MLQVQPGIFASRGWIAAGEKSAGGLSTSPDFVRTVSRSSSSPLSTPSPGSRSSSRLPSPARSDNTLRRNLLAAHKKAREDQVEPQWPSPGAESTLDSPLTTSSESPHATQAWDEDPNPTLSKEFTDYVAARTALTTEVERTLDEIHELERKMVR